MIYHIQTNNHTNAKKKTTTATTTTYGNHIENNHQKVIKRQNIRRKTFKTTKQPTSQT